MSNSMLELQVRNYVALRRLEISVLLRFKLTIVVRQYTCGDAHQTSLEYHPHFVENLIV